MGRALRHAGWIVANLLAALVVLPIYVIAAVPYSRARRYFLVRTGRPPRIVWGPVPIISNAYAARAERHAGLDSTSLAYHVYRINAVADFDIVLERWWRLPVIGLLVPWIAFLIAGFRFDAFGLFFDGGMLGRRGMRAELPLLRLAGKLVLAYPYGGDGRLIAETRRIRPWNAFSDIAPGAEGADDADTRRRLEFTARWATVVLGCADLVLDIPRIAGTYLYPFDERKWRPAADRASAVVRVVHAPNHRHYKGTRYIERAVETLQAEGASVELVLVQGMTNDEAREVFASADVIVDQLLIGAYAMFAIECMALGKPVVCYLNDAFRPAHPEWDECPIVSSSPDQIEAVLRDLVADPQRRRRLGDAGPAYVRRWHGLDATGSRMRDLWLALWLGPDRAASTR